MNKSIKTYFIATRPWSFPVSIIPVLVSTAYLYSLGYSIQWWLALWALFSIILFHAAANTFSDYFDFKNGIDASDTQGSTTLPSGIMTPRQMLIFSIVLLTLSCVNGLVMLFYTSWWLIFLGIAGAALVIAYPWLKKHAMGDLDIFLNFGILPVLGTSLVVTGSIVWSSLWIVLAFASVTVAVLHANNTRDIPTDERAGIRTLPMFIGKKLSVILYDIEVLFPFAWIMYGALFGHIHYLALITLLGIKPAISNVRQMQKYMDDEHAIDHLDEKTAQQQAVCGLLLIASLMIAGIIVSL